MEFVRHMIWAILWAIMVAVMYVIPGKDLPIVDFWSVMNFDKVAHCLVFATLSLTLAVGSSRQNTIPRIKREAAKLTATFCIFYGGVLEYFQGALVQDRTSDWIDFVANVVGVILGLVFFRMLYKRW